MAVNRKELLSILLAVFLSRLRGGEHCFNIINVFKRFLSRLRGGERLMPSIIILHTFLSRLRGGER